MRHDNLYAPSILRRFPKGRGTTLLYYNINANFEDASEKYVLAKYIPRLVR